ncbi:MAG: SAM-dependent methyltransferase [Lentisphaeria bacterium]
MTNWPEEILAASFRDPSGRVFRQQGRLYRSVSSTGLADYLCFTHSGLAEQLQEQKSLIKFTEDRRCNGDLFLELDELPFISYPYEWCFGQLRDAAILTIQITLSALQKGMILKDASAFNVAWQRGKPVFLDHGSFTIYHEGQPWQAYLQFVKHFLGPLLLMKYQDVRHLEFLRNHLEGIPLDFLSRNLPLKTWFKLCPLLHIHVHAIFQQKCSNSRRSIQGKQPQMPRSRLQDMLQSLLEYLTRMKAPQEQTEWGNYYQDTNYSEKAFSHKKDLVQQFVCQVQPERTVDFGANTGVFSFLAAEHCKLVIAADGDPKAVEFLYQQASKHYPQVYPVLQDLNNPSPGLGLFNAEREPFFPRAKADLALGLALLHHLHIGSNWTLQHCLELFARTAPNALLEFVPKQDSQVQRLLRSRPDICSDWNLPALLATCRQYYHLCESLPIADSERVLIKLQHRL